MSEQPEALRLADWLEDQYDPTYNQEQAAAELRRLYAENAELREANETFGKRQKWWTDRMFDLEKQKDALLERADTLQRWYDQQLDSLAAIESQRNALLEALKELMEYAGIIEERCDTIATNKARAAIKAVEEGK